MVRRGGEGDGEDGGGVDRHGRRGHRPAVGHAAGPRRRQGPDQRGTSLPGVKIDGLGGSPLNLLPAAPAVDLGGGGMIAGDPLFDVKEIGVALDQLAREILRHLKEHKLTVVWLFDESTSMKDDQKTDPREVRPRLQRAQESTSTPTRRTAGALNHAIVGFGQDLHYVLEKPRDDIDQIGQAIKTPEDRPHGHREHHAGHPRGRRALRQR